MKKRGLEMVTTTVIMIVLSIAVLTLLVVFLNSQTGFFSSWIKGQNAQSNVDSFVIACDGLVTSESVYAYCCNEKEVVFGENEKRIKMTCNDISAENWTSGRLRKMDCSLVTCA